MLSIRSSSSLSSQPVRSAEFLRAEAQLAQVAQPPRMPTAGLGLRDEFQPSATAAAAPGTPSLGGADAVAAMYAKFNPERVITVRPGQSINAAIKKAAPGTAILVKAGTYKENLNLSGLHGTPKKPIYLISADGPGQAKIVGNSKAAAVTANGISNVAIVGFHVHANAGSGDIGGFKIWGPWSRPPENLLIAGNTITGQGQDGFKLFQGARSNLIVGNTIDGKWRQEAIDNVSVKDTVYAHNTIRGSAGYTGITMKAGSRNLQLIGNLFDIDTSIGIKIGGQGNSRFNRSFPDYWKGFEASGIRVHGNVVTDRIRGKSASFIGARDSVLEGNFLAGVVGSSEHHQPGKFTYHSFNNRILNNAVTRADFFKPSPGESKGYVVSGNAVGKPRPASPGADTAQARRYYSQFFGGKAPSQA